MTSPQPIGIDLGTTYSCVAYVQRDGRTSMIRNSKGQTLTPTVVLFEDREIIVGRDAKQEGSHKIDRYAECVKRDMGSPIYARPIRGSFLRPEVIQAYVLKELRADAARILGPDLVAVITVPAFFDEPRRKATQDAGNIAGLPVLDIVNEPTAAALAFGEILGYLTPTGNVARPMTVLVYDLGGGTFDVTLLAMEPGHFRTLATDGDVHLGGRDWDLALATYVAQEFKRLYREDPLENPTSRQQLLRAAEDAKHTLSLRQATTVQIEHVGVRASIPVTRQLFEELTAFLLLRTEVTTRQLLETAGVRWQDVDEVLLVGGATRMPMVRDLLKRLSGKEPEHRVHPDEAVARGAAIYARWLMDTGRASGRLSQTRIINISSHSLGIEGVDPRTRLPCNAILIPRHTPLPAVYSKRFVTEQANQDSVKIRVLEGESNDPDACIQIGRASIQNLPAGLPAQWPIDVTFEYATNGRLKVQARVYRTDRYVELELHRQGMLSAEELNRSRTIVNQPFEGDAIETLLRELDPSMRAAETVTTSPAGIGGGTSDQPTGPRSNTGHEADASPETSQNAAVVRDPLIAVSDTDPGPSGTPAVPHATREQQGSNAGFLPDAAGKSVGERSSGHGSGDLAGSAVSQTRATHRRRRSSRVFWIHAAMLALSSVLGIVMGYWLLCMLAPQANFLRLPLPMVQQVPDVQHVQPAGNSR